MKKVLIVAAFLLVVGCTTNAERVQEISEYSPVVDIQNEAMQVKYDRDLRACRKLAESVKEQYDAKVDEKRTRLIMGALVGGVLGGITGAAIGDNSDWAARGAAAGAATGALVGTAVAATKTEYLGVMQRRGAKGVVDDCMVGRGHRILNIKGYGGG